MSSKAQEHELGLTDVGPIVELKMIVQPGINVLRGKHGSGKSTALAATTRGFGGDAEVSVRDGAKKGTVTWDGATLLNVGPINRKTGEAALELASTSPIADLVDPGLKDEGAAERARIQALLRLVPVDVTPDAIKTLVAEDANAFARLAETLDELLDHDIVKAADLVRREMHKAKRELEDEAQQAQGEIDGTPAVKPDHLSEISSQEARLNYERAVGDHRQKQGEAKQRARQVEQQEQIRGTLGERPNYENAKAEADAEWRAVNSSTSRRAALEVQIAGLQQELAGVIEREEAQEASAKRAQDRANTVLEAGREWDQRKAILDAPVVGATDKDVDDAFAKKLAAQGKLQEAQETETYEAACQKRQEAATRREAALAAAGRFEKIALGVTGSLGKLLGQAGVTDLTVDDDRLMYVHPNGEIEPFGRRSFAQKTDRAFDLWASGKDPEHPTVAALPAHFWLQLLPEYRAIAHERAKAKGMYVLTEEPAEGDLRVEHYEINAARDPSDIENLPGAHGVFPPRPAPALKLEGGQPKEKRTRKAVVK